MNESSAADAPVVSASGSREYPPRPIVGVGGVTIVDGHVVLIKRRFAPLAGRWSLPGGGVEIGETLAAALVREMREETGLDVEVGPLVDLFDRITIDADQRVQFHYVLADYLCRSIGGAMEAGSDVSEAVLVHPRDLPSYNLTDKTLDVITRALAMIW
ncbi:MAG: NUDIX hydrolase [Acidobacteriota bacterium]